jgi:hypothetical protein
MPKIKQIVVCLIGKKRLSKDAKGHPCLIKNVEKRHK